MAKNFKDDHSQNLILYAVRHWSWLLHKRHTKRNISNIFDYRCSEKRKNLTFVYPGLHYAQKKSNFACKQFFWKILGYFPNKICCEKNLLSPSKNASHTNSVLLFIIWCCCYRTKLGLQLDFFNLFDKNFLSRFGKRICALGLINDLFILFICFRWAAICWIRFPKRLFIHFSYLKKCL